MNLLVLSIFKKLWQFWTIFGKYIRKNKSIKWKQVSYAKIYQINLKIHIVHVMVKIIKKEIEI